MTWNDKKKIWRLENSQTLIYLALYETGSDIQQNDGVELKKNIMGSERMATQGCTEGVQDRKKDNCGESRRFAREAWRCLAKKERLCMGGWLMLTDDNEK